jgi:hypothetical protein
LIAAALIAALVLSGAFLAVRWLHSSDAGEHPSRTATDEQSKTEVVDQARFIVAVAGLQNATAGYLLMSCKNRDDPPYQGAVYMNFAFPADARADEYFRRIAATMVAHGWTERPPPNRALVGKTFAKNGITALLYQDSDSEKHGVARIYGHCNNMTNRRGDSTGWIDITNQLR